MFFYDQIATREIVVSKQSAKILRSDNKQQIPRSLFPIPHNQGIGAARDSGRRRKGGHDKCFGMPENARKVSPLSFAIIVRVPFGLRGGIYWGGRFRGSSGRLRRWNGRGGRFVRRRNGHGRFFRGGWRWARGRLLSRCILLFPGVFSSRGRGRLLLGEGLSWYRFRRNGRGVFGTRVLCRVFLRIGRSGWFGFFAGIVLRCSLKKQVPGVRVGGGGRVVLCRCGRLPCL